MKEEHTAGIPDSIRTGLDVLFVGYNPSLRSGEVGHNYAGRGNRFWKLLFESGLTERLMKPQEDRDLLERGYGFTNIVARPTRRADEITKEEYEVGRVCLREMIAKHRPLVVCFVGKGVYEQYARRREVDWGRQKAGMVTGVVDFVAPSSSGLVRMPYQQILKNYQELKDIVDSLRGREYISEERPTH